MLLLVACSDPKAHVARVRAELAATTPPGTSTVETVDQYLSSKKIEHSFNERSRTMYAIIRNVSWHLLTTTDIQLVFRFDSDRRLVDYTVAEVHTGP